MVEVVKIASLLVGGILESHLNFTQQTALIKGEVDKEVSIACVQPIFYSHDGYSLRLL